jgi:hypothetical protein
VRQLTKGIILRFTNFTNSFSPIFFVSRRRKKKSDNKTETKFSFNFLSCKTKHKKKMIELWEIQEYSLLAVVLSLINNQNLVSLKNPRSIEIFIFLFLTFFSRSFLSILYSNKYPQKSNEKKIK